ncbi:hypothetical protein C8F01DRAFT_1264134 [Mycena amicta]|nr:hypothetical protein C8F01DRAFT_1264134 [Mycena amicta]
MIFGAISTLKSRQPTRCLQLAGENIPWVAKHKYIGLWLCSTTLDLFRIHDHYAEKANTAMKAYRGGFKIIEKFVGRGRLPLLSDANYVDSTSVELLEDVHHTILRNILGVGKKSGLFQLYSELGIYPVRIRRADLALRYLRYLIQLPDDNIARKALEVADRLRRKRCHSWLGDLAAVLRGLPFPTERLPSLRNISVTWCDMAIQWLKQEAKRWIQREVDLRVSLHLLHGRLEPQEEGPALRIPVYRRHYLHRVKIPDHRHALTRLLSGSFCWKGIHRPGTDTTAEQRRCRLCGEADETPAHVFMQCTAQGVCTARQEWRDQLRTRYG